MPSLSAPLQMQGRLGVGKLKILSPTPTPALKRTRPLKPALVLWVRSLLAVPLKRQVELRPVRETRLTTRAFMRSLGMDARVVSDANRASFFAKPRRAIDSIADRARNVPSKTSSGRAGTAGPVPVVVPADRASGTSRVMMALKSIQAHAAHRSRICSGADTLRMDSRVVSDVDASRLCAASAASCARTAAGVTIRAASRTIFASDVGMGVSLKRVGLFATERSRICSGADSLRMDARVVCGVSRARFGATKSVDRKGSAPSRSCTRGEASAAASGSVDFETVTVRLNLLQLPTSQVSRICSDTDTLSMDARMVGDVDASRFRAARRLNRKRVFCWRWADNVRRRKVGTTTSTCIVSSRPRVVLMQLIGVELLATKRSRICSGADSLRMNARVISDVDAARFSATGGLCLCGKRHASRCRASRVHAPCFKHVWSAVNMSPEGIELSATQRPRICSGADTLRMNARVICNVVRTCFRTAVNLRRVRDCPGNQVLRKARTVKRIAAGRGSVVTCRGVEHRPSNGHLLATKHPRICSGADSLSMNARVISRVLRSSFSGACITGRVATTAGNPIGTVCATGGQVSAAQQRVTVAPESVGFVATERSRICSANTF